MLHKTIIQGKIDFGTEKSFSKALKMYEYRAENYHKSDTLFLGEEIFFRDTLTLSIPRLVKQTFDKPYRNTVSLLKYCTQFGLFGEINAWLIDTGKILDFTHMEPDSEKIAVQKYIQGTHMLSTHGKEEEAIVLLTQAIDKYDKHAQAYQKRAKVNVILKRYHEAMRDYTKSINLDESNPNSYYGRAKVHMINEDYELAIEDFDNALKKSVALQSIYWKSRRLKSECHFNLEQYEKAAFDLKLFTKKEFQPESPNFLWKRKAFFDYGRVLLSIDDFDLAFEMFDLSLEMKEGKDTIQEAEKLKYRGIARHKSGKNGYIKDFKDAADLGDKEAAALLKSLS